MIVQIATILATGLALFSLIRAAGMRRAVLVPVAARGRRR